MYNLKLKYKLVLTAFLFLLFSYLLLFIYYFFKSELDNNKLYEYRIELKNDSLYDNYKKYSNNNISFRQFLKDNPNLKDEKEEIINKFSQKYNLKIIDKGYITQSYLKAYINKNKKNLILKDNDVLSLSKEIYRKKMDTINSSKVHQGINTGIIEFKKNQKTNDISPLVAVIDTGIEVNHKAFKKLPSLNTKINDQSYFDDIVGLHINNPRFINKKIPLYYDYIKNKNAVSTNQDHGIHVSGIIGANYIDPLDSRKNFEGVEPDAQIIAFNVFNNDGAIDSNIIKAIEDSILLEVDVINISIGGPNGELDKEDQNNLYGYSKAFKAAYDSNIHLVVAAGNSGKHKIFSYNKNISHKDFVDEQTLYAPGTSKYAFTVGATNKEYTNIADFSSVGPDQELEIKPEIVAPGHEIYSLTTNSSFKYESGTSMASPNTAGAISRSLKIFKDLNVDFKYQQALIMSRSGLLRDINNVPFSPRYQGSGYIKLENLLNPLGYFYNPNRLNKAKFKLEKNQNQYSFNFNFKALETKTYLLSSSVQTISYDDEEKIKPNLFKLLSSKVEYFINDVKYEEYNFIKDQEYSIKAIINLNESDLDYLNTFKYGTYLEGYIIFKDKDVELNDTIEQNKKQDSYIHAPFLGFTTDYNKSPIFKSTTLNDLNYEKNTDITYYQPTIDLEKNNIKKSLKLGSIESINNLDIKKAYNILKSSNKFEDKKLKAYIDDLSNHYVLDDLETNTYQIKSVSFPVYKNITTNPIISFYNNSIDNLITEIDPINDYRGGLVIKNSDKIIRARYAFSYYDIQSKTYNSNTILQAASYNFIKDYKVYFNNQFNQKKIIFRLNAELEKVRSNYNAIEDYNIYIDRQSPEIVNIKQTNELINLTYNEDTVPLGILLFDEDDQKQFIFIKEENVDSLNKTLSINKQKYNNIKAIQVFDYLGKHSRIISLNNQDLTDQIGNVKEKEINIFIKNTNNYEHYKKIVYFSNQDKNEIFKDFLKSIEDIARDNYKKVTIYKDLDENHKFNKEIDKVEQNKYYIEFSEPLLDYILILKESSQNKYQMESNDVYYEFYDKYEKYKNNFLLKNYTFQQLINFLSNISSNISFLNYYETDSFYSHKLNGLVSYTELIKIIKELYANPNTDVYNSFGLTLKPVLRLKEYTLIDPLKNVIINFNKKSDINSLSGIDYRYFSNIYLKGQPVNNVYELIDNTNSNRQIFVDIRYNHTDTNVFKNINFYHVDRVNNSKILYNTIYLDISKKNEFVKKYIEKDTSQISFLVNRKYYLNEDLSVKYSYEQDNNSNLNYYFTDDSQRKRIIKIYKIKSNDSTSLFEEFEVDVENKIDIVENYINEKINEKRLENINRVFYLDLDKHVYEKRYDRINIFNYYFQDKIYLNFFEKENEIFYPRYKNKVFVDDEKIEKTFEFLQELKKNTQEIGYELNVYFDRDFNNIYNKDKDLISINTYYYTRKRPRFNINNLENDYYFDIDSFALKHYKVESVYINRIGFEKILVYRNNILEYIHNIYKRYGEKDFILEVNQTSLKEYIVKDKTTGVKLTFNKDTLFENIKFEKSNSRFIKITHNGQDVLDINYLLEHLNNDQIEVTAIFSENDKYSVLIFDNDNQIETFTIYINSSFERPNNYSKKGYTFENFYLDKDFNDLAIFPININRDLNLYIKYTPNVYIINLDFEGKNVNYNLVYDQDYELESVLGYDIEYKINGFKIPNKGKWVYDSVNLTYKKNVILYNLDIDFEGASSNLEEFNRFTIETNDFTLKKPNKPGYLFLGFTESDGQEPILNYTIKKGTHRSISLKANFEIINYTIEYEAFGKEFNSDQLPKTYTVNDEIILPELIKEGYQFSHWSVLLNGINKDIKKIEKGNTQNLKITAHFNKKTERTILIRVISTTAILFLLIVIIATIIIRKTVKK